MNERPPNEERRRRRAVSTRVCPRCEPAERVGAARDTALTPPSSPRNAQPRAVRVQSAPDQNAVGAGPTVEAGAVKLDFKQPAANEARWRPAVYGGLAAAALAGLLIAPHFLPSFLAAQLLVGPDNPVYIQEDRGCPDDPDRGTPGSSC